MVSAPPKPTPYARLDTTVHIRSRLWPYSLAVIGYSTDCDELVVTPSVYEAGGWRPSWSITHVPTGFAVMLGVTADPHILIDLCGKIGGLGDWTGHRPYEWSKKTRGAVHRVANAHLSNHGLPTYY